MPISPFEGGLEAFKRVYYVKLILYFMLASKVSCLQPSSSSTPSLSIDLTMGYMLFGFCSLIISNGLILRPHWNPQIFLVSHACQSSPEQPGFISSAKAIVSWMETLPWQDLSFTLLFCKIALIHFISGRWINLPGIIWDCVSPHPLLSSIIIPLSADKTKAGVI